MLTKVQALEKKQEKLHQELILANERMEHIWDSEGANQFRSEFGPIVPSKREAVIDKKYNQ